MEGLVIFGIFVSVGIIGLIILALVISSKKRRCYPFKYGGFTKENGYDFSNRHDH